MNRIQAVFQTVPTSKERLVLFITAGDPSLEASLDLAVALGERCADILEIGVPFSDPIADGPTIQQSSQRALSRGTSLSGILRMVGRVRQQSQVPIVLFSYFNPILQYGMERFAEDAAGQGVDGVLITDLPPEESEKFLHPVRKKGLDTIFLAAPTTSDQRLRLISERSSGFIYLVSRTGVTGAAQDLSQHLVSQIQRVKNVGTLPVAVGFGISRREHVQLVCQWADAAVVGSALVERIGAVSAEKDWIQQVLQFAENLKFGTCPGSGRSAP